MKDVKKIDIDNNNSNKRIRRRRKNMTGYYILVAVLAAGIAASLSVTLLFNVHEVVIRGMQGTQYSETELIESSGISRGDNLVRMKTEKIREKMLNDLTFIDDVKVSRNFPGTVELDITPSRGIAYIECQGGYMLISENWRIIGHAEHPEDKSLIVVDGFDAQSNEEKTTMSSSDPDKDKALMDIMSEIRDQNLQHMVSIDISDKYDIVLNYDNRIKIKIEKADDIEYKLRYAYKILTDELRENKSGYLIYRNSLGYSYISDEEYDRINGNGNYMIPDDVLPGDEPEAVTGEQPGAEIQPDLPVTAAALTDVPAAAETIPAPPVGW